ncbi:ABC transporter substrate-binding protein [Pseudonocardia xishanensis]
MAMGQFVSPGLQQPEGRDAAQAAVDSINAAGGINGKQIDLIICNDKRDPNQAAQCARDAVSQNVVAVISASINFSDQVLPVLQRADIAYLKAAPTGPDEYSNDDSFPLTGGTLSDAGSAGIAMRTEGCVKPATIASPATSSQFVGKAYGWGYQSAGGAPIDINLTVPLNSPDYAPTIASLESQGIDCVGVAFAPTDMLNMGKVISQTSSTIKVFSIIGISPEEVTSAYAKDGVALTIGSAYPPLADTTFTGLDEFRTDLAAKNVPVNGVSIQGYLGFEVFQTVAAAMTGPITAESFKQALEGSTAVQVLGLEPIDFSKELPVQGYNRVFNPNAYLLQVRDGKVVVAGPPVDTTPVFSFIKP